MDKLDHALDEAWNRVGADLAQNPAAAARRFARSLGPTYQRPLRSWALVLRAADKRLPVGDVVDYVEWDPQVPVQCAVEEITFHGETIRELCAPIRISWPGVSIDAAARICGVNRSTIHNWVRAGRVVMDVYPHRGGMTRQAKKQIWTRAPIEPGGDVYAAPWGSIRPYVAESVPDTFVQSIRKTHRVVNRNPMCFFQCSRCDKWMKKLYWPQPIWTMAMALGETIEPGASRISGTRSEDDLNQFTDGFVCRLCAGLIYESVERRSRPAPGYRVDVWDRFITRISAGVLHARDVRCEPADSAARHVFARSQAP